MLLVCLLLCSCGKANTLCKNGIHEDWEEYIAKPLIDYVGEDAYKDYVNKREAEGQCADIYDFIFAFDIPYVTFMELIEDKPQYDIMKITKTSYPWMAENQERMLFFAELAVDRQQELTDAVKAIVDSYKNEAVEVSDQYPPYPDHFPPAKNLPEITKPQDYTLFLIPNEGMGARSHTTGGIYIIVWVDKAHQLVMEVEDLVDEKGKHSIGFSGIGFKSGSGLLDAGKAVRPN